MKNPMRWRLTPEIAEARAKDLRAAREAVRKAHQHLRRVTPRRQDYYEFLPYDEAMRTHERRKSNLSDLHWQLGDEVRELERLAAETEEVGR